MDFEDSTQIKTFISVWWFSKRQRWLVVAIAGPGWWRRRSKGLGWCLERKRVKNCVFHVEERIYNLQILLSELAKWESTFCAKHDNLH